MTLVVMICVCREARQIRKDALTLQCKIIKYVEEERMNVNYQGLFNIVGLTLQSTIIKYVAEETMNVNYQGLSNVVAQVAFRN